MLKNVRRFGSPRSLDDPVEDWEGVIQRGGNGGPLAANDGFALERRACFSRFLVSTLAAYRDGEEKLVQSKDAASRPFFTKLLRTQLFSGFLSEAEAVTEDWKGDAHEAPAVCAVRFFDESIRAKANRKTLTVTAKETPFLDATFAATETFIAPPPSREGLRNGAFPPRPDELLRDDLYPPRLRTPRTLVAKEREDERRLREDVRDALRVFLGGGAPRARTSRRASTVAEDKIARVVVACQARARVGGARRAIRRRRAAATAVATLARGYLARKAFLAALSDLHGTCDAALLGAWDAHGAAFSRRAAVHAATRRTSGLAVAMMLDELACYPGRRPSSAPRGGLGGAMGKNVDAALARRRAAAPPPPPAAAAKTQRKAIYGHLKQAPASEREDYFSAFGLGGLKEKRRKRRTASAVFATPAAAAASARLVAAADPAAGELSRTLARDRVEASCASVARDAMVALARSVK